MWCAGIIGGRVCADFALIEHTIVVLIQEDGPAGQSRLRVQAASQEQLCRWTGNSIGKRTQQDAAVRKTIFRHQSNRECHAGARLYIFKLGRRDLRVNELNFQLQSDVARAAGQRGRHRDMDCHRIVGTEGNLVRVESDGVESIRGRFPWDQDLADALETDIVVAAGSRSPGNIIEVLSDRDIIEWQICEEIGEANGRQGVDCVNEKNSLAKDTTEDREATPLSIEKSIIDDVDKPLARAGILWCKQPRHGQCATEIGIGGIEFVVDRRVGRDRRDRCAIDGETSSLNHELADRTMHDRIRVVVQITLEIGDRIRRIGIQEFDIKGSQVTQETHHATDRVMHHDCFHTRLHSGVRREETQCVITKVLRVMRERDLHFKDPVRPRHRNAVVELTVVAALQPDGRARSSRPVDGQHFLLGDPQTVGLHQLVAGEVQNQRINRASRKHETMGRRENFFLAGSIQIVEHDTVDLAGKRFGEVAEVEIGDRLS